MNRKPMLEILKRLILTFELLLVCDEKFSEFMTCGYGLPPLLTSLLLFSYNYWKSSLGRSSCVLYYGIVRIWVMLSYFFFQLWVSSLLFSGSEGLQFTYKKQPRGIFLLREARWSHRYFVYICWLYLLRGWGWPERKKRWLLYPNRSSQTWRPWASPFHLFPIRSQPVSSLQTPPQLFPLLWSQEHQNCSTISSVLCLPLKV